MHRLATSPVTARRASALRLAAASALLALALAGVVHAEGWRAGIAVDDGATPSEIGLPLYPGARPYRENAENSDSAQFRLWGGAFGLSLAAGQYASADSPERVTDFYRQALAQMGRVLDCGQPGQADTPRPTNGSDDKLLRCKDDKPKPGGRLLKTGVPTRQFIVNVEPAPDGRGTRIGLVRLEAKGFEP